MPTLAEGTFLSSFFPSPDPVTGRPKKPDSREVPGTSNGASHSPPPASFLLPGKPYGADDFLPVLMYVLARSHLTEMLLDVEYMMELMDPALQLGEGESYLRPDRTGRHWAAR